jgi:hypothetical protein
MPLFASLACATDVEMGYDPTMTWILVDQMEQFLIYMQDQDKIETVMYQTVSVLANF